MASSSTMSSFRKTEEKKKSQEVKLLPAVKKMTNMFNNFLASLQNFAQLGKIPQMPDGVKINALWHIISYLEQS